MKHLDILVESCIKVEKQINKQLNESSSTDKLHTLKVLNKIKATVKNPRDVERFIGKYSDQIIQAEEELSGQSKKNLTSAFSKIKYAISKGWNFIKRHWGKILALILIISLALFFKFGLYGKLAGIIGSWLGSGGNDVTFVDTNAPADDDIEVNITNDQSIDNQPSGDNNVNVISNNNLEVIDGQIPTGDQEIFGYLYNVTPEEAEQMREYLKDQGIVDQKDFEQWAKDQGLLKKLRPVTVVNVTGVGKRN